MQAMRLYIQTRILRCKMLVGNTQTLKLHPMDAGYVADERQNRQIYS